MIRVETVDLAHIYFTGIRALDGVNFAAEPGEFIVLLGPNGSGKTTLLKHFVGLLKPTSGKVLLDSHDIATLSMDKVRTEIGFVFQDPNDQLFAATVAEDVAFGPKNLGLGPTEVERRVLAALEIVGAQGLESRPVHSLSYGQKRRVSLAGILAMSPKMLVLDEPTSGLDPMGATRLMGLLRRINEEQGITIIVATHDVDLVPAYAEKVYVMRGGRVVASGNPPAIFSRADVLYESELRVPRAAHALRIVGDELGHPIVDLPLTMEDGSFAAHHGNRHGHGSGHDNGHYGGFTTGVAAAAAAKAAAELLLRSKKHAEVQLRSPMGSIIRIPIRSTALAEGDASALATVVKEGVSPDDVTHGAEICALVTVTDEPGITIEGGEGVGRVVGQGLSLAVGEAAINPVPRQMIADAVSPMLPSVKGLKVVISVPLGEALAKKTNNAEMGIVGGIAILGTSIGLTYNLGFSSRPDLGASAIDRQDDGSIGVGGVMISEKKAVLLIGHGSRAAGANDNLYRVADLIRQRGDYPIVELGFMGLNPPSIGTGVETCIAQGATKIIMLPYFLHMGIHMQEDLPAMLEELKGKHPAVEMILGSHIGFHPKLVEIVVDRINESDGVVHAQCS